MKTAPFNDPEMVGVTPTAGFIVNVLIALADAFWIIVIGKVSEGYVASTNSKTTAPVIHPLLYAFTAAVRVEKLPATPTV